MLHLTTLTRFLYNKVTFQMFYYCSNSICLHSCCLEATTLIKYMPRTLDTLLRVIKPGFEGRLFATSDYSYYFTSSVSSICLMLFCCFWLVIYCRYVAQVVAPPQTLQCLVTAFAEATNTYHHKRAAVTEHHRTGRQRETRCEASLSSHKFACARRFCTCPIFHRFV